MKERSLLLQLRVTAEERKKIQELADREDLSVAQVVRQVLNAKHREVFTEAPVKA